MIKHSFAGMIPLLLMFGGAALPAEAIAKPELKYQSGLCTGVDAGAYAEWYSVTIIENGKPVSVFGRGCDGKYYNYDLCGRTTVSDPTNGDPPTHTGTCDAGIAPWLCQIRYNTNHVPVWMGGQDCYGAYYVDDDMVLVYPEEPGGNEGELE